MDQSRSKYCCLLLSLINSRSISSGYLCKKNSSRPPPHHSSNVTQIIHQRGKRGAYCNFSWPSIVFLYRETSRSRLTSRQEFEWSRDGDKNRARSVDEARQLGHVTDHSTDVWRPLFRESLACVGATCACDRTFSWIFDD